jgi:hypothetical protein
MRQTKIWISMWPGLTPPQRRLPLSRTRLMTYTPPPKWGRGCLGLVAPELPKHHALKPSVDYEYIGQTAYCSCVGTWPASQPASSAKHRACFLWSRQTEMTTPSFPLSHQAADLVFKETTNGDSESLGFWTLSIVRNSKHVSETGCVSVLRWGEGDTLLGPSERANLNHWTTGLQIEKYPRYSDGYGLDDRGVGVRVPVG